MTDTWEVETHLEMWNNRTGESIRVGPDRDGSGGLQLRVVGADGTVHAEVYYTHRMAPMLSSMILRAAEANPPDSEPQQDPESGSKGSPEQNT